MRFLSNSEFRKSIFMIVLFLLSLFQMGILWSEKNPGVPFPFSPQTRNQNTIDIDEVKENYYRPENVLISSGKADLYYRLDSSNNLYQAIWKDFKDSYLKQIIQMKPIVGDKDYERDWDSLSRMKVVILEFIQPIPTGIISWMEGTDYASGTMPSQIYKIAVFPSEDINNNKNTLYVYDGLSVYKYVVTIEQGNMKKEEYIRTVEAIEENTSITALNRLITFYPVTEEEDLLVTLFTDKDKKIWDLLATTPEEIILERDNIDRLKEYLLDDDRGSITKLSGDGTNVIFSYTGQVYRYYYNGFLEYQYRGRETSEKGRVEEAFAKALTFIEYRRRDLVDRADIILSKIEEDVTGSSYIFTFNYVIDDMNIKIIDQEKSVKSAIIIKAAEDRVLDAKWYIKTFAYNDYSSQYSLSFFNLYENQFIREYPQLKNKPIIMDISIDYLFSENGTRAEPYWMIETDSQGIFIRMRGKE